MIRYEVLAAPWQTFIRAPMTGGSCGQSRGHGLVVAQLVFAVSGAPVYYDVCLDETGDILRVTPDYLHCETNIAARRVLPAALRIPAVPHGAARS